MFKVSSLEENLHCCGLGESKDNSMPEKNDAGDLNSIAKGYTRQDVCNMDVSSAGQDPPGKEVQEMPGKFPDAEIEKSENDFEGFQESVPESSNRRVVSPAPNSPYSVNNLPDFSPYSDSSFSSSWSKCSTCSLSSDNFSPISVDKDLLTSKDDLTEVKVANDFAQNMQEPAHTTAAGLSELDPPGLVEQLQREVYSSAYPFLASNGDKTDHSAAPPVDVDSARCDFLLSGPVVTSAEKMSVQMPNSLQNPAQPMAVIPSQSLCESEPCDGEGSKVPESTPGDVCLPAIRLSPPGGIQAARGIPGSAGTSRRAVNSLTPSSIGSLSLTAISGISPLPLSLPRSKRRHRHHCRSKHRHHHKHKAGCRHYGGDSFPSTAAKAGSDDKGFEKNTQDLITSTPIHMGTKLSCGGVSSVNSSPGGNETSCILYPRKCSRFVSSAEIFSDPTEGENGTCGAPVDSSLLLLGSDKENVDPSRGDSNKGSNMKRTFSRGRPLQTLAVFADKEKRTRRKAATSRATFSLSFDAQKLQPPLFQIPRKPYSSQPVKSNLPSVAGHEKDLYCLEDGLDGSDSDSSPEFVSAHDECDWGTFCSQKRLRRASSVDELLFRIVPQEIDHNFPSSLG